MSSGDRRPHRLSSLLRKALSVFLFLFIGTGLSIDRFGQQDRASRAPVIVVLGCGVRPDGQPSDSLRGRTMKALRLYRRGMAKKILFTGGRGTWGSPESIVAASLAKRLGVPAQDVLIEQSSHSTRENASCAKDIIDGYGWKTATIVSDPYHLLRATLYFKAVGVEAFPSPAREVERNRKIPLRLFYTAREVMLLPAAVFALTFSPPMPRQPRPAN